MATPLKTDTGVKYDGTRQLHDLSVDLLSKWHRRAKISIMGGVGAFKRTCMGLVTAFVNQPWPYGSDRAPSLISRLTPGLWALPRMQLKRSEAALLPA